MPRHSATASKPMPQTKRARPMETTSAIAKCQATALFLENKFENLVAVWFPFAGSDFLYHFHARSHFWAQLPGLVLGPSSKGVAQLFSDALSAIFEARERFAFSLPTRSCKFSSGNQLPTSKRPGTTAKRRAHPRAHCSW